MELGKWDRYGSCHTAEAWSETYGYLPLDKQPRSADGQSNRVVGPEALANQIRYFMTHNHRVTSAHHVHQPEISYSSPTEAAGIWPLEDHRSEERRVGKQWVSTCKSRLSPNNHKQQTQHIQGIYYKQTNNN